MRRAGYSGSRRRVLRRFPMACVRRVYIEGPEFDEERHALREMRRADEDGKYEWPPRS